MKQTAVEWLVEELEDNGINLDLAFELIEQAKEIEKQQIIDAYEDGYSDSDNTFELNKEYYNETFNK
jgi:HEPN domain-containing protein